MSAVVTDKLKRDFLQVIYDDIKGSLASYYIAIGRGEDWNDADTVPTGTPDNSIRDERNFRLSAQAAKKVVDISFVVPRFNWTSGTNYSQYDDARDKTPGTVGATNQNPYYVITDEQQVYICLKQSRDATGAINPSTVQPTGTDTKHFETADGYIWKYLYTIGGAKASAFLSANFMPVEYVRTGDAGLNALQQLQAGIRDAAIPKQILGIELTNEGGVGYTSAPTVTIYGNGDSAGMNTYTPIAEATAFISGGAVSKIEMADPAVINPGSVDSVASFGRNYDYANIVVSGGGASTDATARAVLHGNDSGVGANPVFDLRSTSLMFDVKIEGEEEGADTEPDFPVNNRDFRQIGIIKDPRNNSGTLVTAETARIMPYFTGLTTDISQLASLTDPVVTQTGGFSAIIGDVDGDRAYYYQTEATGFRAFNIADNIENPDITNFAPTGHYPDADIDNKSGEIVYIENRAAIQRSSGNTDDIKIIITL